MSELSQSIQQKLQRIREIDQEKERLSREVENEYYTTERLASFWERFRLMKREDIIPLITMGHVSYDEEFARCYRCCMKYRLFAFGQMPEVRLPPVPVDEAKGPAPVVDYDARHREALRIRDEAIAKANEDRGEIPPDDQGNDLLRRERLDKVAAQTIDFEQRADAARKITEDLSTGGSRNEHRELPAVVEPSREEILARIASENADLEKRRAEAKRIQDAHLSEAELSRQSKELPASLQRTSRPVATPATPAVPKI